MPHPISAARVAPRADERPAADARGPDHAPPIALMPPVRASAGAAVGAPTAAPAEAPTAALRLLIVWLLVTAVPILVAGVALGDWWGGARHGLLLGVALAALAVARRGHADRTVTRATNFSTPAPASDPPSTRAGAAAGVLRATFVAWAPLVAVPGLYAELPLVAAGLARTGLVGLGGAPVMHDAAVIRWELAAFGPWLGGSPAMVLATRLPWTALSELLHLAYLSYYVIIYVPPALLWWEARRRREAPRGRVSGAADPAGAFAASAFTVLLAFVCCYSVFVVFPVQGPWYTWDTGGAHGLPLTGWIRASVQGLLVAGSSRGTAFPSSHVAVSVAQTVVLARVAPRLAWLVGPATALLALGAVYGGYHYGVDAVVGAAVGAVVGWAGVRVISGGDAGMGRRAGA